MTGGEKIGVGFALLVAFGLGTTVNGRQPAPESTTSDSPTVRITPADTGRPLSAQAPPSNGRWRVSEDVSAIDDSKSVTLSLDADGSISGWPGKVVTPTLVIRCQEKRTSLYIANGMSANVEYGTDGATVTLRIDSTAAFKQEWSKSTDNEALFAPSPAVLARRLARGSRLIYRFVPFNSSPAEATFSLVGLGTELGKVATACKWPAQ